MPQERAREKVKLYLPPSRVIYLKLGVSFSFLLERRQLNPSPCAPRIGPSQIYLGGFTAWSCYCASGWGRVTLSGSVPVPYGSVKRARARLETGIDPTPITARIGWDRSQMTDAGLALAHSDQKSSDALAFLAVFLAFGFISPSL